VPVTLAITALSSGTATLTWDPVTDLSVKGYKVYAGTNSGAYGAPVDVENVTTFQIINLQSGNTYYFAVTAYNSAGESGYSNEVNKSIP
jgi:fibronectin type 3 domain-containing protein